MEGSGSQTQQAKCNEARKHLASIELINAQAPCNPSTIAEHKLFHPELAKIVVRLSLVAEVTGGQWSNCTKISRIQARIPEMLEDLKIDIQRDLESKMAILSKQLDEKVRRRRKHLTSQISWRRPLTCSLRVTITQAVRFACRGEPSLRVQGTVNSRASFALSASVDTCVSGSRARPYRPPRGGQRCIDRHRGRSGRAAAWYMKKYFDTVRGRV
jgi:hypothetical protein